MAMTKPADMRARTDDELSELLLRLRKEQFNLRFQRATGQLEALSRVREVRRDIARIKTVQVARKAAGQRPDAAASAGPQA